MHVRQIFDSEDTNSDCIALMFKGNDMAIMLLKNTVMKNMIGKNGPPMTDLIGQQHSLVRNGRWPTVILYSESAVCDLASHLVL